MIKVGTICYIKHPHTFHGKTCETLSTREVVTVCGGYTDPPTMGYRVKLSSGEIYNSNGSLIGVHERLLVPISDSDFNEQITRQRIAEDYFAPPSTPHIEALRRRMIEKVVRDLDRRFGL